MAVLDLDELYATHVKPLPAADRLRLLAMVAQDLVQPASEQATELEKLTITERLARSSYRSGTLFRTAEEVDAYVREERDAWES